MLEITKQRETVTVTEHEQVYEWVDCPGAGFSFPVNDKGEIMIDGMTDLAKENLKLCQTGQMRSKSGATVIDKGIRSYTRRWIEPAEARCICGHIIQLGSFTNTCERCSRDYNFNGASLAPRSQWGEETGETAGDILSAGHTIS